MFVRLLYLLNRNVDGNYPSTPLRYRQTPAHMIDKLRPRITQALTLLILIVRSFQIGDFQEH